MVLSICLFGSLLIQYDQKNQGVQKCSLLVKNLRSLFEGMMSIILENEGWASL